MASSRESRGRSILELLRQTKPIRGGASRSPAAGPCHRNESAPLPRDGFRVRRTLEDPNVWYPANAYAGWRMPWVGIAAVIVAVAAYLLPGLELSVYASIVGVVIAIGLIVGLVQSFAYLRKLTDERRNDELDGENGA